MSATKAEALYNSKKLSDMILEYPNITHDVLYDIAELLDTEDSSGHIADTAIIDLYNDETLMQKIASKAGYPLYNPDGTVFVSPQEAIGARYLYVYIVYLYKFASNDSFWRDRLLDFIPQYDQQVINDSEKLTLLFSAIGYEFDKIEQIISDMAKLNDVYEAPNEYLAYLAQILGYEKEDFQLGDTAFREIVKNIIEIYQIKGTNYSFKFFFKFLGFDYEVTEMFFDRDRDVLGVSVTSAANYLTSVNPKERFEFNETTDEVILSPIHPSEFTETKNLEMFDLLADAAGRNIDPALLLGEVAGFPDPYTYFKTNLIQHELSQFYQGDAELMPSDPDVVDRIINKYITFLSPTYIQSSININLTPYSDGPILVYEDMTIGLIKQIYDIVGVNASGSEWEQLKSDYDTSDTEEDEQGISVTDEQLLRDVIMTTDGAPLSDIQDAVGDYIQHNGVHARGRESSAHIIGLHHVLTFRTALENVITYIDHKDWDFTLTGDEFLEYLQTNPYPPLPVT